eukprot:5426827-Alexandrium_andersonii.AAC.1
MVWVWVWVWMCVWVFTFTLTPRGQIPTPRGLQDKSGPLGAGPKQCQVSTAPSLRGSGGLRRQARAQGHGSPA